MCSEFGLADLVIPQPLLGLTTRRVLTMEWITGVKLTTLQPDEVRALVRVGQEAFLTQLLDVGYFHGGAGALDPRSCHLGLLVYFAAGFLALPAPSVLHQLHSVRA